MLGVIITLVVAAVILIIFNNTVGRSEPKSKPPRKHDEWW